MSLVEQTAEILKDRIVSGHYPADESLPPQGELATELSVSRPVLREAMRTVASLGLIEVSQGRLPRVRPVGPEQVASGLQLLVARGGATFQDLIEVRRPLEIEIVSLAARRRHDEDLARLAAAIRRLLHAETLDDQVAADRDFHLFLARASGNPLFECLLEAIVVPLEQSMRTSLSNVGIDRGLRDHKQIAAAVHAGDPKAAQQAMARHLRRAAIDQAK